MWPTFPALRLLAGKSKFVWLRTLKKLAPTIALNLSVAAMFLFKDRSVSK